MTLGLWRPDSQSEKDVICKKKWLCFYVYKDWARAKTSVRLGPWQHIVAEGLEIHPEPYIPVVCIFLVKKNWHFYPKILQSFSLCMLLVSTPPENKEIKYAGYSVLWLNIQAMIIISNYRILSIGLFTFIHTIYWFHTFKNKNDKTIVYSVTKFYFWLPWLWIHLLWIHWG